MEKSTVFSKVILEARIPVNSLTATEMAESFKKPASKLYFDTTG